MSTPPASIQQFVKHQATLAIADLWEESPDYPSPYGSHWYRAVACMLLAGRVAAKINGQPNLTDVNRVCKEANFNQHFCERIARFLLAAKVVQADRQGKYSEGPNHAAFWKHDSKKLPRIAREAVLHLIQEHTGSLVWRPTMIWHAHLIEFLTLFFASFKGRALDETALGRVMQEFSRLPEPDVRQLAKSLRLKLPRFGMDWEDWLDDKGQRALKDALFTAAWAYAGEHKKAWWVAPSPLALGMLGLAPVPAAPSLPRELKVAGNLAVFAGAGLGFDKLVPLFRSCTIKRLDQFFEFQVDPRRLQGQTSRTAAEELHAVLAGLQPLPSALAAALATKSELGGKLAIRACSALVKPQTPQALDAIRRHPSLKGYLEPKAPPGYLLIKPTSSPQNFVRRCQELGFEVEQL